METEEAKLVFTKYDEMLRLLSKYVTQFYHIVVCLIIDLSENPLITQNCTFSARLRG